MASQHALIIGGTSGIGLATADMLLRQNFTVTIAGRDPQRMSTAVEQLRNEARTVLLDAADQTAARTLMERLGIFDHLVLAFGSNKGLGPFPALGIERPAPEFR